MPIFTLHRWILQNTCAQFTVFNFLLCYENGDACKFSINAFRAPITNTKSGIIYDNRYIRRFKWRKQSRRNCYLLVSCDQNFYFNVLFVNLIKNIIAILQLQLAYWYKCINKIQHKSERVAIKLVVGHNTYCIVGISFGFQVILILWYDLLWRWDRLRHMVES